jgi:hypothetical protein
VGVVALLVPALVLGLLGAVGLARALRPPGDDVAGQQLRHLVPAVRDGAADDMALLFPEGRELTQALTALAALQVAEQGRYPAADALRAADRALAVLDDPATDARFALPQGSIFVEGWALQVAAARARLSDEARDDADARERATQVASLVQAGLSRGEPFLASYPGRRWPVDTVVAVSGLARAGGHDALVREWVAAGAAHLDPATGLLPHEVDAGAAVLEGPRGTSSVLESAFWPSIDPALSAARWQRVVDTFVVRRAGLVGVREFPAGVDAPPLGDVDSGPLVAGVSLSASAVALAGARLEGDAVLADGLDREAEVAGLPLPLPGGRTYAGGVLPVGEAFLVWARSHPASSPVLTGSPAAVVWPWPPAGCCSRCSRCSWWCRPRCRRCAAVGARPASAGTRLGQRGIR